MHSDFAPLLGICRTCKTFTGGSILQEPRNYRRGLVSVYLRGRAFLARCDIDEEAIGAFGFCNAAVGGIDILVANASALSFGLSVEAFQSAFDVDLIHALTAVEAAMPYIERSRSGSIVAIGSIGGVEDSELNSYTKVSYGAIKAALHFYIKSLARTVAPKGIRANVVSPGSTFFDGGAWARIKREQPERFRNAINMIPMGRMARPDEIANVVAFTASPAASYVTGLNLVVDGAFTRRI